MTVAGGGQFLAYHAGGAGRRSGGDQAGGLGVAAVTMSTSGSGGRAVACGRPMNNGHIARRPPQTRYAQSSGAKIAYQVSGTGPPDLVMVPGLVSHLDIQWQQTAYRRFVRALERGSRLIRLDKRGTGLSDPAGPSTAPLCGTSTSSAGSTVTSRRSGR
jgi:hypothetical protein